MVRLSTFFLKAKQYFYLFSILNCLTLISISLPAQAETDFLTPEDAFVVTASSPYQDNLIINFDIHRGYFLYQKHFKFTTLDGTPININNISFPLAIQKKNDETSHAVYANKLNLSIPIEKNSHHLKGILVGYQGCSENGFCYNPMAKKIIVQQNGIIDIQDIPFQNLTLAKHPESTTTQSDIETKTNISQINSISEIDRLTNQLKGGSFFITILIFLGVGIVLAFTPCVLPMIPILMNILVGENKPLTSGRSTFLASVYVLSVAVCYAGAGVVAAFLGTELQASLQNPLFLVGLSFVLMLFALSQFNFIYIQFPPVITKIFNKLHIQHKKGSAIGACTMGIVSALMVSPCVTPALVVALTYIGQTGNIFLGGSALFALALGMGIPMLVIAILGSHLLPKAGPWMTQIKNVTGVLLIVLAGSILFRAFPAEIEVKAGLAPQIFATVNSRSELKIALDLAKKEKQPVILDVYADWCVSCKQIDKDIFSDRTVLSSLQNAKLLRFDITKQTTDREKLKKELGIIGPPTVLFFTANGEEAKSFRLVGQIKSNDFINHFNSFLNRK